jgi:hypothetical protein
MTPYSLSIPDYNHNKKNNQYCGKWKHKEYRVKFYHIHSLSVHEAGIAPRLMFRSVSLAERH